MAKKIDRQEDEATPPPRLADQGDAGTEEIGSATQPDAAKGPKARAGGRQRANATGPAVAANRRMTLTLSARAAKRLRDWCHVKEVDPGAKVSQMILDTIPSCSIRINEPGSTGSDTGEDRQTESAA